MMPIDPQRWILCEIILKQNMAWLIRVPIKIIICFSYCDSVIKSSLFWKRNLKKKNKRQNLKLKFPFVVTLDCVWIFCAVLHLPNMKYEGNYSRKHIQSNSSAFSFSFTSSRRVSEFLSFITKGTPQKSPTGNIWDRLNVCFLFHLILHL